MRSTKLLTIYTTVPAIQTVVDAEESFSKFCGIERSVLRFPQVLLSRTIMAGLRVVGHPLNAIENVAYAAINLLGMFFSKNCSFSDAIGSTEQALLDVVHAPIELALSPFKILSTLNNQLQRCWQ